MSFREIATMRWKAIEPNESGLADDCEVLKNRAVWYVGVEGGSGEGDEAGSDSQRPFEK